jgi:predicted ATPase/class 3 adenylate cyclase/Tfp pilus assembly protein PilF
VASPPTGTLTFLFTDIEGSTKMWEHNATAMQAALARHDEMLRDTIEERGGYVFKTVGDAFCAVFPTALDALEAALDAQRRLLSSKWVETGPLRVRMALHMGVAEERDGDYFGPPLNRVARLLSAAHGGQVLLTAATHEMVRDQLPAGADLLDLGERRLKDLFRPERVFQLSAPELPSKFPPLRTLEGHPNNLPLQPTPLVGREREVEEVAQRLLASETRLLTLTGAGGVGKTRLALQVAADLLDEFSEGTFFVALANVTDPALVASAMSQPLEVKESGGQPLEESLKAYLQDKHMLLVLDNFEQVLEGAPVVGELVAACPKLKVLATSRIPLRLYGEQEYAVPPLALPDPRVLPPVKVLTQYEAVRLFVERARAVKADFEVTNESAPAVAEICARLDGLPLAIELAAARIRVLPPHKMLERLGDRLKLLRGGARDLPTRQQTLRGTIDWSYDLLEEGEKTLFGRLSVFSGGRTLEAIEEICDPEGELDSLEGVESLLEKSLLRQEEGPQSEPRFVMLETVHEYAREKLQESGEAEEIKRAHAEHFLALAEEAESAFTGPDQLEWLERLEAEHDNMRAALSWALEEGGDAGLGLRLAGALSLGWLHRGHLSEARSWLEEGLMKGGAAPASVRAQALEMLSYVAITQDDLERHESVCEEALTLNRKLQDKAGIAQALDGLGWAAIMRGDLERASTLLEEALATAQESGHEPGIAMALNGLAVAEADRGDFDRAEALWEEALALNRRLGNFGQILLNLGHMGYTAAARGDLERADALHKEELELARESRSKLGRAWSTTSLGLVAALRGDLERADALLKEGLRLHRELETRGDIAECLEGIAEVARARGDARRSARLWGAADGLREASATPWMPRAKALHEPRLNAARSRLDGKAWEEAFAEGRAMTLDEAVSYAMVEEEEEAGV